MKLLTISNLYPRPEAPQRGLFNLKLFSAFAAMGHSLRNVCPVPGMTPFEFAAIRKWRDPTGSVMDTVYFPVFHIPLIGRNLAAWFLERALKKQKNLFEECDVVLSSWLYPDGVAAGRLARDAGKPHWMMCLGSDVLHLENSWRRSIIRDACNRAAGVICVAKHLADALAEAGVEREKIHVVPNGVDTSLFHFRNNEEAWRMEHGAWSRSPGVGRRQSTEDREQRSKGGIQISDLRPPTSCLMDAERIILFVGNLVLVKRPELALSAFAALVRATSIEHRPAVAKAMAGEASSFAPSFAQGYGGHGKASEDRESREQEEKRGQRSAVRDQTSDLRSPTSSLSRLSQRSGHPSSLALVFIGEGPMRRSIEQRAESMGLAVRNQKTEDRGQRTEEGEQLAVSSSANVVFLGSLPHEKVAERMARAKVLILTSRSEGMPNVVLEAMASGLPVVSTPVGAIPEMIRGEPLATTADDAEGLARGINSMLGASEQDRMAMSQRHSLRTWDTVAAEIIEMMK